MGYNTNNGFTPDTVASILESLRAGVNAQLATSYTAENFVGTNIYKLLYPIAQEFATSNNLTAEIYSYLQNYIASTNEAIAIPKTPRDGLIENFANPANTVIVDPDDTSKKLLENGLKISLKVNDGTNGGNLGICIDIDNTAYTHTQWAAIKTKLGLLIKDFTVASLWYLGSNITDQLTTSPYTFGTKGTFLLSNGQTIPYDFYLPTKTDLWLKYTITKSTSTSQVADSQAVCKAKILANIAKYYRLGIDFEPAKYGSVNDFTWASGVVAQYSLDGTTWLDGSISADFDDFYKTDLARIEAFIA